MKCELCGENFKNNLGGQLTNHLQKQHTTSFEDYVVLTEYKGISPKCECGFCNDRPNFYRGKFRKYALEHDSFFWREEQYRKHYGEPVCKYCKNIVGFHRGEPRIYCSRKCSGNDNGGFTKSTTQDKIRQVIKDKYGVNNVSELDFVKEKIIKFHTGRTKGPFTTHTHRKKISESSKKLWKNEDSEIEFQEE